MKKNIKLISALAVAAVVVAAILIAILETAGGSLDVIGRKSISSFESVLEASGERVSADEENAGWSLEAPDGSVRFIWGKDQGGSPLYDLMLELDAEPFANAGLDAGRLPEYYSAYEGMLMVGTKLGNDKLAYEGEATPLLAYEQIAVKYRDSVGYHAALDHYNVALGNGNMFEWAKDMKKNSVTKEDQDKDIVFVLDPEPLIAAGVDPEKVEGWVYTTVSMEMGGKAEEVYKFLKPFDLQ